jgi:hypothetical protein
VAAQGQIEEFLAPRSDQLAGVVADGRDLLEDELNRDLADGCTSGWM